MGDRGCEGATMFSALFFRHVLAWQCALHNMAKPSTTVRALICLLYRGSVNGLPGHGNLYASVGIAAEPTRLDFTPIEKAAKPPRGLAAYQKLMQMLRPPAERYCSGGFFSVPGLTERM